VARKAVERRPTTPSGQVSYKFTVALPRDLAERLTARAIREGRASKGSLRKSSRRRRGDAGDISFRIGLTPSRARAGHRLNQADGLGPSLPGRGQPAAQMESGGRYATPWQAVQRAAPDTLRPTDGDRGGAAHVWSAPAGSRPSAHPIPRR
jgi:hypothetical protein